MTKFLNKFSEEIYTSTYKFGGDGDRLGDQNITETQLRIAQFVASIEKDSSFLNKFNNILENFKFVPGGRITANAGTGLKGTTLINCFVSGPTGGEQDSMGSILDELKRQGLILKSEGGYGFCADFMRPRGAYIAGVGVESPGAVKMLEMWDKQSEVITAGSNEKKKTTKGKNKIRKGAMMVTMSIWHPSVEEFITAKQSSGRLTKFNMSVLISDEFMAAVENKQGWKLEFPDTSFDKYDAEWNGVLPQWKEKSYPTIIYKEFAQAQELWDLIMNSTYTRNEPGVLFIDTINRLNNLSYCEYINATNPCGEQILPPNGSCLLGSINLAQYVNESLTDFDYAKLEADIPVIVRFLDNVNDLSNYPLPEQKIQAQQKRRIGLGYLGYASALYLLQIRYGSPQALILTNKLCDFITNKIYQSSALLAKEKGSFPLYNEELYLASNFVKNLSRETISLIKKYGIRNSHLTSIQPTGNSSVFANNVSSGLEPIFLSEYIRTVMLSEFPDGLTSPKIDFDKRTVDSANVEWNWVQEGDEYLLATQFNEIVYKIDKNRGLLKEEKVQDYAVAMLKTQGIITAEQDWAVTTKNISIDAHVDTMKVFAKYIDSAISKTVNLPKEYPYEEFKSLYKQVFETGVIKGCTTYREGTMASVLSSETSLNNKIDLPYVKRPKTLQCDIHHVKASGQSWIVLVGLLDKKLYEVFSFKQLKIALPTHITGGTLTKVHSGKYNLECGGWLLQDVSALFESDEQDALTRMISIGLRNGVKIEYIVDQLMKSEGNISSFSKATARTLKRYIQDTTVFKCSECGSKNVALEEGCFKCRDCGSSKCG